MPNMSRRHISSYDKYTHAESFYSSSMKPNRLFSERTYTSERTTATTIVKRFFFRIFVLIVSTVYLMWRSVTYILESAHSLSLRVAKNVYRITSRVMLMDTWLLRKRGNRGKAASLVVLCLLPLLLLVGWWIASNISEIHEKFYIPFTTSPATAKTDQVQSFSSPDGGAPEVNREKTDGAQNIVSDLTRDQLETVANLVKSQLDVRDYVDYDQVLDRLLNTEAVRMTINNYIAHSQSNQAESELNEKMEKQRLIIEELKDELGMMRLELSNLNRCCKKSGYLDLQVFRSLTSLLNNPDFLQRQEGLKSWLNSLFVAKIELENKLSNLTKTLDEKFDGLIETSNKFLIDKVVAKLSLEVNKYKADASLETDGVSSLTDERIKDIVKGILKIYDADRTGLVDYAMEPVGGQIITTRCTESYHTGSAVLSILGLPLWYPTSTPRTVITPGINPGECWAFQNFPGLLVIKLMAPIRIEAFSLEHISKLLVPEGKIDSAPKDFEVYGLGHEEDRNGIKIGEYRYDYNGESLQYFVAENPDQTFEYIELRIISNHGNPNYTCLYRFRVHGQKQAKSS
ncbi:hypothetical protein HHI36_016048 [Cryptolaemus montrouzieri]|uniref:SUN domain-containing protein n=1 Tax=Cryptolaemus montrouzieri TaxID=559131 RepID=A0ABD2N7Q3_9CUCU